MSNREYRYLNTLHSLRSRIALLVLVIVLVIGMLDVASGQEIIKPKRRETPNIPHQTFQRDSLFDILSFWHPSSMEVAHTHSTLPSNFTIWNLPNKIDLAAPWKMELARRDKYHTMEMILGTIEMAGVGYVAYQHVRKYGWD